MQTELIYVDALPQRRADILARLAGEVGAPTLAGGDGHDDLDVRVVERLSDIPTGPALVLVGATDLAAALPELARVAADTPGRQVLLLWEGEDQKQLIAAIQAGVRDIIALPSHVPEAIRRALDRHAQTPTANPRSASRPGRVIAVFSSKGGIGKSMLSANLAIFLHRVSGQKTLAVDMSLPFGNLDMYLDLVPTRGVADLLAKGDDLDQSVIEQALTRHSTGISLLAGSRGDPTEPPSAGACTALWRALAQYPGIVVVDLGSYIEGPQAAALAVADLVVVPVSPLISSVGLMPTMRQGLRDLGIPDSRIMPVLNRNVPDGDAIPADMVARLMGGKPRHVLPWGGALVASSLNNGVTLAEHPENFPLARALGVLASDVMARVGLDTSAEAARPRGVMVPIAWLRSLFGNGGGRGGVGSAVVAHRRLQGGHAHVLT